MLIPTCLIKFLELTLTIACLTLHNYSYDLTDIPALMLCSGTYIGYIVVLSGEIVGEVLLTPLDLVQDMYFGMAGIGLFSMSGGLILSARTKVAPYPRTGDHSTALVAGSLALVTAVLMLFDLSLAYLDSEQFDDDASVAKGRKAHLGKAVLRPWPFPVPVVPGSVVGVIEIGEAVSATTDLYIDSWWSAIGGMLFATCGGLTLHGWRDVPICPRRNYAQISAVCALAIAALMTIDALIALCTAQKDDTSTRSKSTRRVT